MMLTGSTVLRSQKGLVRSASRALSTAPVKPPDAPKKKTPEQLAEYQARQLKFNQKRGEQLFRKLISHALILKSLVS